MFKGVMTTLLFNFSEKEHCSYEIIKGLRIHFECVEPNIAHMYFTNAEEDYIDVPKNNVSVLKHIPCIPRGTILEVTDPLLEPWNNKKRMRYFHSYYILNKFEEYEICYKYKKSNQKYTNSVDSFFTSIRLVPQHPWKMVNLQLTDYKKHS
jgi:hypothetical protein